MSAPFVDTTFCQQTFHWFLYTPSGVKAFHSDDHECETSEFRLPLKGTAVDGDRCPECGHTPETGACIHCKMD